MAIGKVIHVSSNLLIKLWGKFTFDHRTSWFDRFADHVNTKTKKINWKYLYPGTIQVGAFSVSSSGENYYVVSSVYLIPREIAQINSFNCEVVLIVLHLHPAAFWLLFATSKVFFKYSLKYPFVSSLIKIRSENDWCFYFILDLVNDHIVKKPYKKTRNYNQF